MERDYEALVDLFIRKYQADVGVAQAWARHFARNQSGAKGKYITEARDFARDNPIAGPAHAPPEKPLTGRGFSGVASGIYGPGIPRAASEAPLQVGGMSIPLQTPASMGITALTPVDVAPRTPKVRVRDLAGGLPAGGY